MYIYIWKFYVINTELPYGPSGRGLKVAVVASPHYIAQRIVGSIPTQEFYLCDPQMIVLSSDDHCCMC